MNLLNRAQRRRSERPAPKELTVSIGPNRAERRKNEQHRKRFERAMGRKADFTARRLGYSTGSRSVIVAELPSGTQRIRMADWSGIRAVA